MGIRAHTSDSPTPSSPSGNIMAPTIKFRAKNKDCKLVITVVSCSNLPDADLAGIGFGNKSDPYVTVRIGKDGEKQQTKAIPGKLNPVFKKETSTFTFDVEGDVTAKRIYFEVMDKDTFTKDDLIGEASHKLSAGRANGVLLSLALHTKEEEDSDKDDEYTLVTRPDAKFPFDPIDT